MQCMRLIMKGGQGPSLFVLIYTESMASFDSFPSEANRMAQGACDGSGTTRPDYVSSARETSLRHRAQTAPNKEG